MRFGFMVSSDDPPGDGVGRLHEHVERAQLAADAGFDSVAVAHRYSYGPATSDSRGDPLTTSRFQPLILLGHLSGVLGDRVDYITTVLLSVSAHPVQLAEDVATLDAMCVGRLRLGIGLGWLPFEFEAFGVASNRKVSRLVELVALLRALLSQDNVDFEGRHFGVRRARLVARPVQRPHPPFWIGASTVTGVRRAARIGDTWTISAHASVGEITGELEAYRDELQSMGRPLPAERPISRMVYLARTRREARDEILPLLAARHRAKEGRFSGPLSGASDEELARGRWIVGTPAECIEQIDEVRAALDVNHMVFTMPWAGSTQAERLRTIELLGSEVLPAFKQAAVAAQPAGGRPCSSAS
jgi:alkanesulfonate monooxygenase SsuD/methylene tetrahydromethanopterin reductase-like flavin-dependent oxidoreductase (luciferase family)